MMMTARIIEERIKLQLAQPAGWRTAVAACWLYIRLRVKEKEIAG